MNEREVLHSIIERFTDTRVLVVGDLMLDVYERCVVDRISPEAPIPVALVQGESYFVGGAGNVAHNLSALGVSVSLVGVLGIDQAGKVVRQILNETRIDHEGVFDDVDRVTTQKRRIIAGTQQLIRIDRETTDALVPHVEHSVCAFLEQHIPLHDAVVISDYCKGLFTDRVIETIKRVSKMHAIKVYVDSKDRDLAKYVDFYLVKPNKKEAERFAKDQFLPSYENLETIGKKLRTVFNSHVVITLGGDGIALFEDEEVFHVPTQAREVFDVSGAGDTVLAALVAAVSAGATLRDAVHLANHAAGHVVGRVGTTVCSQTQLKNCIDTYAP